MIDRFHAGRAAEMMRQLPEGSIDLIVTSPPYWTAVVYDGESTNWPSYEAYIDDMQDVWKECARVLRPNGKLCINAPIMPIPKAMIAQHTRHLKNIAFDMEAGILAGTDLERYGLFVWQKQTSKMMFGSYPQPGNIIENNTIEFINVYVKPGKPPRFSDAVKAANRLSRAEWLDLTQQVWFIHPAPFPEKLPARLMRLYTQGAVGDFAGEIVLDPFVGPVSWRSAWGVAGSVSTSASAIWIMPAAAFRPSSLRGPRCWSAAPDIRARRSLPQLPPGKPPLQAGKPRQGIGARHMAEAPNADRRAWRAVSHVESMKLVG